MMKLECLEEHRIESSDAPPRVFEETRLFGYTYEVDEELGKQLLKTGKFRDITPPEEE